MAGFNCQHNKLPDTVCTPWSRLLDSGKCLDSPKPKQYLMLPSSTGLLIVKKVDKYTNAKTQTQIRKHKYTNAKTQTQIRKYANTSAKFDCPKLSTGTSHQNRGQINKYKNANTNTQSSLLCMFSPFSILSFFCDDRKYENLG